MPKRAPVRLQEVEVARRRPWPAATGCRPAAGAGPGRLRYGMSGSWRSLHDGGEGGAGGNAQLLLVQALGVRLAYEGEVAARRELGGHGGGQAACSRIALAVDAHQGEALVRACGPEIGRAHV